MVDLSKWKEFEISKVFPKISVKKFSSIPEEEGDIPFISSTSLNNGVSTYSNECSYEGKCITVSTNGNCFDCFYHEGKIALSNDVEILVNPNLNESNALFICTILNKEQFKWNYGRKPKNDKVFETVIRLPQTEDGKPNWKYMTEYVNEIENRERESGRTIKDSLMTSNKKPLSFNTTNWKPFILSELFDIKYGVNLELSKCNEEVHEINFVARTAENNGISSKVERINNILPQDAGLISVAGGGSVLSTFYQDEPFYSGRDLYILRAKKNIDKYAKLFIITLIKREKYKYSYGRQANKTLPNIEIKLPVIKDGSPDYEFMSNYIRALPFGDRI